MLELLRKGARFHYVGDSDIEIYYAERYKRGRIFGGLREEIDRKKTKSAAESHNRAQREADVLISRLEAGSEVIRIGSSHYEAERAIERLRSTDTCLRHELQEPTGHEGTILSIDRAVGFFENKEANSW